MMYKQLNGERIVFLEINNVRDTGQLYEKNGPLHTLILHTKINSKCITNLKENSKL